MATTIAPTNGAAPLWTHQGVGASPGYSALDDRRMVSTPLQAGVVGGTDFMVVPRGAGANMSVDIGMPTGALAYVLGDSITGQGLYAVPGHSATINEVISANATGNPRIDSIYLQVQDNILDSSGQNRAQIVVVNGTATSGATLNNRTGAGAAPASALRLADVLVANGAATIPSTVIRDRRSWARGAFTFFGIATPTAATTSYATITGASDSMLRRIELSGVPIRVRLVASYGVSGANQDMWFQAKVGSTTLQEQRVTAPWQANANFEWIASSITGSQLISIEFKIAAAGGSWNANPQMIIEEVVRGAAVNNSATSG